MAEGTDGGCSKESGEPPLRVLELFAGIGGWRLALEAALPPGSVATFAPYDSGPHCSEIYALNFGEPCCRRNIEQLEPRELEGFDIWLMSPPCQPFSTTKDAKQGDLGDKRCKALDHLCAVLPRLAHPPRFVALENVKGFKGSAACAKWRGALEATGFTCRQLLLDLADFGTPNHRTRFYLLAERSQRFAICDRDVAEGAEVLRCGTVLREPEDTGRADADAGGLESHWEPLPPGVLARGPWARLRREEIEAAHSLARAARSAGRVADADAAFQDLRHNFSIRLAELRSCAGTAKGTLEPWLLDGAAGSWKLLPLPKASPDAFVVAFDGDAFKVESFLADAALRGDEPGVSWSRAGPSSTTRRVAEFLDGGPAEKELLVPAAVLAKPFARGLSYVGPDDARTFCFTGHYGKVMHKSSGSLLYLPSDEAAEAKPLDRDALPQAFEAVRFFSPREILNILGFPSWFVVPRDMALAHRYKSVGNSIAVTVAARLLEALLPCQGKGTYPPRASALAGAPTSGQ